MIQRMLPRSFRSWIQRRSLRLAASLSGFEAARYWEARYSSGGTSGEGSFGRLAEFKARVLNEFIVEHRVGSVIEFGCGDGNQLSLLRAPRYAGLDISRSALKRCIERFIADGTKSFFLYEGSSYLDSAHFFSADLVISLDVIYHVIADADFEMYMDHLFSACKKHLILYTIDYDSPDLGHQRHRAISEWMQRRAGFVLRQTIPNPFSGSEDNQQKSDAMFLIYERISA